MDYMSASEMLETLEDAHAPVEREPTETQKIAARVLELAGQVGVGALGEADFLLADLMSQRDLKWYVENSNHSVSSLRFYLDPVSERGGEVTLYVEKDWGSFDTHENAAGDWVRKVQYVAKVNWSAWGSTVPEKAQPYVNLIGHVCELARRVNAEFGQEREEVVYTKAEREAQKVASAKQVAVRTLTQLLAGHAKGFRLNTPPGAFAFPKELESVPAPGRYTVQIAKRVFDVTVTGEFGATFVRVS